MNEYNKNLVIEFRKKGKPFNRKLLAKYDYISSPVICKTWKENNISCMSNGICGCFPWGDSTITKAKYGYYIG